MVRATQYRGWFCQYLDKYGTTFGQYSWGLATLAWLYRQLCDGCKRSGADSNLGGCAYLLQIWVWERFPVGRPYRGPIPVSSISLAQPHLYGDVCFQFFDILTSASLVCRTGPMRTKVLTQLLLFYGRMLEQSVVTLGIATIAIPMILIALHKLRYCRLLQVKWLTHSY